MQDHGIFCQFKNKLAITHTIAIKWKEKYDAVVVDCHDCSDRMKISLPNLFLRRLPLLSGSHLGRNFGP